ncbi:MAG: HRDC domain-containing protein, partial [Pseudomonadota bacterium]|nr:HRDC domain-containing protein [Pseudomonadota bacterium]
AWLDAAADADPPPLAGLQLPDATPPKAQGARRVARERQSRRRTAAAAPAAVSAELVAALTAWRRAEAQKRNLPAFRILTDRVLLALATARPRDERALLAVAGIGPALAGRYGRQILDIVNGATARS